VDSEAKIQKYYDGGKMRRYVMYMEQFWALSVDPAIDGDRKKAAHAMYEHYSRMTLCTAAKEMSSGHGFNMVINIDYMKNMYRKYVKE